MQNDGGYRWRLQNILTVVAGESSYTLLFIHHHHEVNSISVMVSFISQIFIAIVSTFLSSTLSYISTYLASFPVQRCNNNKGARNDLKPSSVKRIDSGFDDYQETHVGTQRLMFLAKSIVLWEPTVHFPLSLKVEFLF